MCELWAQATTQIPPGTPNANDNGTADQRLAA